jgi:hypothetical protein
MPVTPAAHIATPSHPSRLTGASWFSKPKYAYVSIAPPKMRLPESAAQTMLTKILKSRE